MAEPESEWWRVSERVAARRRPSQNRVARPRIRSNLEIAPAISEVPVRVALSIDAMYSALTLHHEVPRRLVQHE